MRNTILYVILNGIFCREDLCSPCAVQRSFAALRITASLLDDSSIASIGHTRSLFEQWNPQIPSDRKAADPQLFRRLRHNGPAIRVHGKWPPRRHLWRCHRSLVSTIPVTPADSVNSRACCRPFCPVVASMTSRTLVRRAGNDALRGAAHFIEFSHKAGLGVQTSGSVDDDVIRVAGDGCLQSVEQDGGRIASGPGLDDFGPGALSPDFELLDGRGRKVSAAHSRTFLPWERKTCDSLPMVVVFPVPFTPTTRITSVSHRLG